MMQKMNNLDVV